MHRCFKEVLLSDGPAADRAGKLALYGRFIVHGV